MSKYYKIKKGLFLVEQEVDNSKTTAKAIDSTNQLWIYDRSGSMSGDLRQLVTDMKQRARTLSEGDTLTLAWFSGERDHRFILKGYKISSKEDFKQIDDILDKNNNTIGTTCFSEVLDEASKTIEDLSGFGNFSLMLFTDGAPCVSNYNKEIEGIFKAIGKLAEQVTSALLVGYGSYYNKSLMQEMAEKIGGSLVHSNDIASFGTSLDEYITSSREAGDKIKVKAEYISSKDVYFSIFGKSVISYKPNKDYISYVIGKGKKDFLYILTDKLTGNEEEIKNLEELGPRNSFIKGMYGLATILSQKTETLLAVDVLGALGDKHLIDLVYDSFTNDEYGRAEKNITDAMASPSARFKTGRVLGYIKPDDAPCLLDALDAIMADSSPEFFPYAGDGYSRIGAKSINQTETKFIPDDKGFAVGDIVWSSSKLNLSLSTVVTGVVELDDDAKKLNLTKEFACSVFRNFTIIKDGRLNIEKPVFKLSKNTHDYLKSIGCTDVEWFDAPITYDLTAIPVMNRKYANSVQSVKPFCELAAKEFELEGIVKVLKANAKVQKASTFNPNTSYTDAIVSYLAKFHIKNGIFSPPVTKVDSTDYYMSKTFEIKVKGLSSLPKVDDVIKKIAIGKTLTISESMVKLGLDELKTVNNVELAFQARQKELREVRAKLLKQKFSLIVGKAMFTEFSGERKNEYTYNYAGHDFKFVFGEERIDF